MGRAGAGGEGVGDDGSPRDFTHAGITIRRAPPQYTPTPPMIESLLRTAARLPTAGLVALTGLLSLGESAFLIDFLIPGEASMIFMGAAAAERDAPVVAFIAACISGALVGDSIGYFIGRRFGRAVVCRWDWTKRLLAPNVEKAERFVEKHQGTAVLAGRWVGTLRAVVPLVAGSSRMRFRTFLAWDILAAITWGTTVIVAGYLLGRPLVRLVDRFEWIIPVGVLLFLAGWWITRRRRRQRQD